MTDYYGTPPYPAPLPVRQRPTGVTILAILDVLMGVLCLLLGLAMLIALAMVGDPVFQSQLEGQLPEAFMADLGLFLGALTVALMAMGAVFIVLAYGFLNGKRWAWFLALGYGFLSIGSAVVTTLLSLDLLNILSLGLSMAVPVLIIVYLFQPHVKNWFSVA